MQGLLLNNFYSMQNNIKTSFGIALCLLFVSFVAGDTSVLNAVIAAQIMVFPVNVGASLQIDEASKWSRIEITLPIKKENYYQCQIPFIYHVDINGHCNQLVYSGSFLFKRFRYY